MGGKDDGFGLGELDAFGAGGGDAINRLITLIKFLGRRVAAGEAAFRAGLFYEAVRQYTRGEWGPLI